MDLLPDRQTCGLCMRRECREPFPRQRLQRKLLVIDPGMHHGTCVTLVPWSMSGSITRVGGENVPGIPGACTARRFANLIKGPLALLENKEPHLLAHPNINVVLLIKENEIVMTDVYVNQLEFLYNGSSFMLLHL